MGTPLLAGRDFDARDTPQSPKVAIVTEAFARKYFAGRRIRSARRSRSRKAAGQPRPFYEIVGVVKDTKYTDLREAFTPLAISPRRRTASPSRRCRSWSDRTRRRPR